MEAKSSDSKDVAVSQHFQPTFTLETSQKDDKQDNVGKENQLGDQDPDSEGFYKGKDSGIHASISAASKPTSLSFDKHLASNIVPEYQYNSELSLGQSEVDLAACTVKKNLFGGDFIESVIKEQSVKIGNGEQKARESVESEDLKNDQFFNKFAKKLMVDSVARMKN